MSLTAAHLSPQAIAAEGGSPVLAFAADELRTHLAGHAGGMARLRLTAGAGERDGFVATVSDDEVVVSGDNPRGALNGVYWLLEQLGWLWVEPGPGGVTFTPRGVINPGEHRHSPALPRRTLILGQDALHDDWPAWLEWASRNRYNDLFFHDTPPSVLDRGDARRPSSPDDLAADRRGWMFERWDADGTRIAEEARRRGMTLQFGGHHLPTLVPRSEFDAHPEWFPLRGGRRDARYNVCTASEELQAHLARRVEAFVARFPAAGIYHFWGDDIRGGGWCECGRCPSSASDQALLATNLIAETVARQAPGARVAHLAYHDTLLPPVSVRPHENVVALFAPRERCYAHAIDDPSCERNRERYWTPFQGLLDAFSGRPEAVHVFEYYSDAILFKGLAPTHLGILPRDTRAYRQAGVSNIQDLMVGDRPWIGPPWHAWWTARCLWDPAVDAQTELARFCMAAYGSEADVLRMYYDRSEPAYRLLLDLHDFAEAKDRDVLDFSDTPRETLRRKAVELAVARAAFLKHHASLANARSERARREATQADFVAQVTSHLASRASGWYSVLRDQPALAATAIAEAHSSLDSIARWDEQHNTPAYAVISRRMRRAMAHYTSELERLAEGR